MADSVREAAAAQLSEIEKATAVVLPEPVPAGQVVTLASAPPEVAGAIRKAMGEIDMGDTGSIVRFGSAAQAELQEISQAMLADVATRMSDPPATACAASSPRSADSRFPNWMCGASAAGGKSCWAAQHPSPFSWRSSKRFRARSTRSPTIC